jgi:D-alanyl-D-alanine carboxypeptidase (penicillin-binding protein 5/6)
MSNYRKERKIDREGEEGEKGRKYVIFPLFFSSFFAANLWFECAFAVKNSFLMFFHIRRFSLIKVLVCIALSFVFSFSLHALDPAAVIPDIGSRSAVLMDAATGTVLYAKNGDEPVSPASLTKLMTIHIALEETASRRAALEETVPLPRESWAVNQPPRSSLMFLAPGQIVSLRELLLGLAISSGNDAAVAVALRFAPTVEEFADRMNREARNLGLNRTSFVEPSGISEYNMTTPMEFTRFCREYIRRHPETLRDFHSVREFAYPKASNVGDAYREQPGTIVQKNRNTLLGNLEGVDGLKTGYIDEAGYHIALTAARLETRLIAVIMGAPAAPAGEGIRDRDGRNLLNWGFAHFKTLHPPPPELAPRRVWKGKTDWVSLVPGEELTFTALRDRGNRLRWETETGDLLIAPLDAGSPAGTLVLYDEAGELRRIPLLTAEDVGRGGFWKRLWDSIRLFFKKHFG